MIPDEPLEIFVDIDPSLIPKICDGKDEWQRPCPLCEPDNIFTKTVNLFSQVETPVEYDRIFAANMGDILA